MARLEDQLKQIAKQVEADSKRTFSIDELFDEKFMQENTHFSSWKEFEQKSGYSVQSQKDLDKLFEDKKLDPFTASNTKFDTFEEMYQSAAKEKCVKQLKDKGYKFS